VSELRPAVALPRELVRASAGAGKTYRISSRIIGLLAAGQGVDAILASTFTRKAAGEILERVLARLAHAALDPAEAARLARDASFAAGDGIAGDCDRWSALLVGVLRDLHRLSIGTLDAFFLRAAQVCGAELGLPPAWTVADEATAARLRADALRDVLRRGDPGMDVELVRLINRGATDSRVHEGLMRRLKVVFEAARQSDPSGAAWRDDPAAYGAGGEPPEDRGALAAALEALPVPANRRGAPNCSWEKALAAAAGAVRRGDWEAFTTNGLAKKVIGGEDDYCGIEIEADVLDVFQRALATAHGYLARELAAQAGALRRLTALFDHAFRARQRREGAYDFTDIAELLGRSGAIARADLRYRLDARLRHVLLDEFQDTSVLQWQALRPLVAGALDRPAEERAVVIVADGKQSIYGWRGASPELVDAVAREHAELGAPVGLAVSWRSSLVVLDAVNRVFGALDQAGWPEEDLRVVEEWSRWFEPHRAAHPEQPGCVRIAVGPRSETRAHHRPALLRHAAGIVQELHAQAPGFGIGVLVEENKSVARVIYELRALGIEASEEGGNTLTDSPAVASVLALLRLADHPDDSIARYHVARTPVGEALGWRESANAAGARRLAASFRRRLLEDGYGHTLGWLVPRLAPACDARDLRRLGQLTEMGFRFDPGASLRPMDFVRRVASERVEDPHPADVRVMTIHQSKGLEFDIVVLPELDTSIFRRGGAEVLPFRAHPAGPITELWPPVNKELARTFPVVLPARAQERAIGIRDALGALYVAMTRARFALHLVVEADGERRSDAFTPARIVRNALAPDRPARLDEPELFTLGDPAWYVATGGARPAPGRVTSAAADAPREPAKPAARAAAARRASAQIELLFEEEPAAEQLPEPLAPGPLPAAALPSEPPAAPPAATSPSAAAVAGETRPPEADAVPLLRTDLPRRRMLPRRAPSALPHDTRVDLGALLRLDARTAAERGTLVHAWCERVGWLEDGLPDDGTLAEVARAQALRMPPEEVAAVMAELRRWLAAPEIAAALARASYPPEARLERERAFLHRQGDAVVQGKIDRLVTLRAGGRVIGAEVLDYKSDGVAADAIAALVEEYRPQMEAYRAAVAAMYALDPAAVRARLVLLAAGVVRTLD
jgi:ATP-dependent exoDNAse (exonuclease V) beta subunit